jgi:ABC-2 type transport system ATP-binding protein
MHALAIEASGLAKTYGGFLEKTAQRALDGLDLRIEHGTAFGLIGPNGAGKTTFIKILLGIVRPTDGHVRILGAAPDDLEVRRRIGYLPERLHLPRAWKPAELLASVARMKKLALRRLDLLALIERVGLSDAVDRKIGGFSKGMRQRLGLAAALLGKPDLLILDEPTDGIDPLGRVEVRKILTDELARGATLFLNSHLLAETERVCERVGILAHGKLVQEGRLDDLRRTSTRWIVKVAPGAPEQALMALGLSRSPRSATDWICEAVSPEALNVVLDRARRAGALLVGLDQDVRDLEDVLAAAVRSGERARA